MTHFKTIFRCPLTVKQVLLAVIIPPIMLAIKASLPHVLPMSMIEKIHSPRSLQKCILKLI